MTAEAVEKHGLCCSGTFRLASVVLAHGHGAEEAGQSARIGSREDRCRLFDPEIISMYFGFVLLDKTIPLNISSFAVISVL